MSKSVNINELLFSDLERTARSQGISVTGFIEQTLRAAVPSPSTGPFTQRVHDFGVHLEAPWTVLSEIETDAYTRGYDK